MPMRSRSQQIVSIVCLIIAAEAIFCLPYHVARYFRPSLLLTLDLTNTELGLLQSAYGAVAMIAYLPGGPIADLFPARKLLTASLAFTGLGGFYFSTLPNYDGLWLLFAFWGLTTILLFWGALIRATREWGSPTTQGRAYGILDGGRGLLSALMASMAVVVFQLAFPEDPNQVTPEGRADALRSVILFYTGVTLFGAVLAWLFVAEPKPDSGRQEKTGIALDQVGRAIRMPTLWIQAVIIVCAYVAFKAIDNYSLFAVQAWGMNEVEGARLSAISAWIRPVAAVGAGLLGDRFLSSRIISLSFAALILSYFWFGLSDPIVSMVWLLFAGVAVTCAAVFALRAIYFALLEEGGMPAAATGTAVGIISFIGYSPDVFQGPLSGWLLDRSPGAAGHQDYFLVLIAFVSLGLLASMLFTYIARRNRAEGTSSSA